MKRLYLKWKKYNDHVQLEYNSSWNPFWKTAGQDNTFCKMKVPNLQDSGMTKPCSHPLKGRNLLGKTSIQKKRFLSGIARIT